MLMSESTVYILARQVQLLVLIAKFGVPLNRKLDCFALGSLSNLMFLYAKFECIVVATISKVEGEYTVYAYKYNAINNPSARAARLRALATLLPDPPRSVQDINRATTMTQPPVPIQYRNVLFRTRSSMWSSSGDSG